MLLVMGCNGSQPDVIMTFDSPEYGVYTSMWWEYADWDRVPMQVNEMGFGWVKHNMHWREIEQHEKGKFDWFRPEEIVNHVEAHGLNLLIRLDSQPFWSQEEPWPPLESSPPADYQNFFDFCGTFAEKFKGRVAAYQVWNEPNLDREWGNKPPNPVEYTALLKGCYEAIKLADPDALVITAGFAPTGSGLPHALPAHEFIQGMYDAGAADYFDILGVHAAGFNNPPEMSSDEAEAADLQRWMVFRYVEDLRAVMLANGDGEKQMAILEMGWTTDTREDSDYAWHAVTEELQAEYLVRAYQFAQENWRPWMGLMTTVYISDSFWTPEDHEQYWWSIVLPDGTPRPAFYALKEMEK